METCIISDKAMSEKQFGQKRQSMEKEIRGSLLVHESEFLDHRKIVTNNIFLLNLPQMQHHHPWNLIEIFSLILLQEFYLIKFHAFGAIFNMSTIAVKDLSELLKVIDLNTFFARVSLAISR